MGFGEKLRELRGTAGLTQDALAVASGVPLGTIRDYEQGKRTPLLATAQKFARALGVSLDVFPVAEEESAEAVPVVEEKKPATKKKRKEK